MSTKGLYRGAYPKGGQVALLCEGDLIGYEYAALTGWLDSRPNPRALVDIWPCGTSSAIYGICDAIGRACPLVVVEDRDFRTLERAQKDCDHDRKDRLKREVRICVWRTWRRNEIENYFLELPVLLPVMEEWFGCSEEMLKQTLAEILPPLSLYQAVQATLYEVRSCWEQTEPDSDLRSGLKPLLEPQWEQNGSVSSPAVDPARAFLMKKLDDWQARAHRLGRPFAQTYPKEVIQAFEGRLEQWAKPALDDDFWRCDWSGKEVLQWLRKRLSHKCGWPDPSTGSRRSVDWTAIADRKNSDALDRDLEAALRPDLVRALLRYIADAPDTVVAREWNEIAECCRKAAFLEVNATGV